MTDTSSKIFIEPLDLDIDPGPIGQSADLNDLSETSSSSSGDHSNGSEPSTPATEQESIASSLPPDMEEERLFRPYAIEEPEDPEDPPPVGPLLLPCLPDNFERWQRDLVDDMDDMGNVCTRSGLDILYVGHARGQKRKPGSASNVIHPCSSFPHVKQSRSGDQLLSASQFGLSPKRRRRRSRLQGDTIQPSLYDFRETLEESSGSEMRSSDESAESSPESALTDDMDID
ncbi:hypothetical protein N7468_009547 [Penicillium chermesinum]|uniref:Uncharacterized protein n=1 Tax=Penicillium chermesinum TaxID=63820 RepID=A0A9W9NKH4_9EURO|nr:uncharacterized protein N7468_009547 [Penicillium chermesinum]KAJ5220343.1 hypothetical protein N7468_009547 [Penicillium chermesinum]KAJ6157786.1 hypothetical protein N7470_005378 [Penicillium chermesinum]